MTLRSSMLLMLLAFATAGAAQTPAPAQPVPAPARMAGDGPSGTDPRVCLEFPTREQVTACAEKYRPRRAAAKSAG